MMQITDNSMIKIGRYDRHRQILVSVGTQSMVGCLSSGSPRCSLGLCSPHCSFSYSVRFLNFHYVPGSLPGLSSVSWFSCMRVRVLWFCVCGGVLLLLLFTSVFLLGHCQPEEAKVFTQNPSSQRAPVIWQDGSVGKGACCQP